MSHSPAPGVVVAVEFMAAVFLQQREVRVGAANDWAMEDLVHSVRHDPCLKNHFSASMSRTGTVGVVKTSAAADK